MNYEFGKSVCDMHYGRPEKDFDGNPINITSVIELECENSHEVLQSIFDKTDIPPDKAKSYLNKIAIVVGLTLRGKWQAVYSYDDNMLGMLEFESNGRYHEKRN